MKRGERDTTTVNKYRRGKVKCGACQTLVAKVGVQLVFCES